MNLTPEPRMNNYRAADIDVLKGLDPVRRRPGMYTDTTRPNHLAQEVIDNSVDEALAGYATTIRVTLHATNSVQALERIYNFFPREQRHQIQPELAENLHCLITQRLLPRSDRPGRIVAMEMMMNTPYISHLISEGDLGSIPEAMERGNPAEGVFTFDHSIFELYESGVISFQDAINYVESENNFRIRIRAQSNRRLPPEMQSRGEIFSVKSDDALSRELMRKDREERERLRKEGKL